MEILFVSSFTTSSARFSKFDSGNMILLETKVFSRNIIETALVTYFIKVISHPCFTWLRVKNRVQLISKWKISYENSVVSPSYLNLPQFSNNLSISFSLLKMSSCKNLFSNSRYLILSLNNIKSCDFSVWGFCTLSLILQALISSVWLSISSMEYDLNANILPNNFFFKLWSCALVTLMADSYSCWVGLTFKSGLVILGVIIFGHVAVLCLSIDSSSEFSEYMFTSSPVTKFINFCIEFMIL